MEPEPLSHNQLLDRREVSQVLRDFLADPERHEAYFAVSKDFWERERQDQYEEIYASYATRFGEVLTRLSEVAGVPTWQGSWGDPACPEWAVGERIAVWDNNGDPFSLALYHEDREVPILVRLAWAEE